VINGSLTPSSSISWIAPAFMKRTRWRVLMVPFMTRIEDTTPRY